MSDYANLVREVISFVVDGFRDGTFVLDGDIKAALEDFSMTVRTGNEEIKESILDMLDDEQLMPTSVALASYLLQIDEEVLGRCLEATRGARSNQQMIAAPYLLRMSVDYARTEMNKSMLAAKVAADAQSQLGRLIGDPSAIMPR